MSLFGRQRQPDAPMVPPSGTPGVSLAGEAMAPDLAAMLLSQPADQPRITERDILQAAETLAKYKKGKATLERRVVEDEQWWEIRHWEVIRAQRTAGGPQPEPTSAWLHNAIVNKHADLMDNYPEPVALPRERGDEDSAKMLSSVLPVVMEQNDFEQTYSDNGWDKIKHGTCVYGVFWDRDKENGLGDIAIQEVDLLKIFWEPGIQDIQDSRNLFIVDMVDTDILEQQYPQYKGKLDGDVIDVKEYVYDDTIDTSHKTVVVDWYYKIKSPSGRTVLHYVKFVGKVLLYASANDPQYRDGGWYEDGDYPVVFDPFWPEKGTPAGFGLVAICKDPQMYIDKLSANIQESAMMGTKKRFFASEGTNINEEEFLDWTKPIIHVQGQISDVRLKELTVQPLSAIYQDVLNQKVEEMKETSANRDMSSGGTSSGVTAAAAIAALQEAGNKVSRDMISASYRAHRKISAMVIERMRQFYDGARAFRITGDVPGTYDFIDVSNAQLRDQLVGTDQDGNPLYRRPVYDIKIKAQKRNPFNRMEQNEMAKELYARGFFSPDRAQESLIALDMMDFEGKEKIVEAVQQGQTLLNLCQQMGQQMDAMAQIIQAYTGIDMMGDGGGMAQPGRGPAPQGGKPGGSRTDRIMQSRTPQAGYAQRIVQNSTPKAEHPSAAAAPQV